MSTICKVVPGLRTVHVNFLKPSFRVCQRSLDRNYWSRRDSSILPVMQSVENCLRDMDREMNRAFGEMQRSSLFKLPRFFAPIDGRNTREIPIITNTEKGRNYQLQLAMEGMQPEDISITLKDNVLTVKARKEEKGSKGSFSVREYSHSYNLPEDLNPESIRTVLSDGVLNIEASLPALESKEIPIRIETAEKSKSG